MNNNPETEPRSGTEMEWQQRQGRVGALELLMSQAWVAVLKHVPDEQRDDTIMDALIAQENRFHRLHHFAQSAALDSAEGILTSALVTVRQGQV